MITPDFGWSHRLLPLNALTGHVCTNLATGREGGTVPKTIAILGSALFFAVAPSTVAGLVPWWITRWEVWPPLFHFGATPPRRGPFVRRRSARACRLVCALCAARIGHAGADRTDAEPRGDGSLSLRAQSYLRCPCRRHSRPSGLVRRPAPSCVRCVGVARLPRVCRGVRGAGARS